MRTSLSNMFKRKLLIFTLLTISALSFCITESFNNFENIIYGKVEEKAGFLKPKTQQSEEKPFEKFFILKNNFEEIITNFILSNSKSLTETKKNNRQNNESKENKKNILAFRTSETNTLNITEYTVNSLLFMLQRAIPINLSIKNDNSNPLPLAIDTASLSLIIPELSAKYSQNTNMTLTVYENNVDCAAPEINMAIDGIYINFDIGLKMAVFNEETQQFNEILDTIISAEIKATVFTQDNKLNVFLMKVVVNDLNIKNNVLDLDKDTLEMKFTGFLSLIIDQTRKMLTEVDVLKSLNNFSGLDFTSFEVMSNVGSMIVTIQ